MKLSDVGNNKEYNKVKNSIKQIFNSDNYCLIRAIVIAIAFIENGSLSVVASTGIKSIEIYDITGRKITSVVQDSNKQNFLC